MRTEIMDTPETDSRTQHVVSYLGDVNSSGRNQPCQTVVPSTWAQTLERQRDKARKRVDELEKIINAIGEIVSTT